MSQLEEMKARAEKATPGPWESGHTHGRVHYLRNGIRFTVADLAFRDAEFIAHARTDVPKLIAALEAALATADALIEENQDATTLQGWGLMTAAQKVRDGITEALQ